VQFSTSSQPDKNLCVCSVRVCALNATYQFLNRHLVQ